MKILVSNIGSTSFKFRLFDMAAKPPAQLAAGGADRIGQPGGVLKLAVGEAPATTQPREFPDHAAAITFVVEQLVAGGALRQASDLGAVAFKAVMGGDLPAVTLVDQAVLEQMEYFVPVAPAHNPPYIAAMRMFAKVLKDTPLVAAFEPGFHRTNPPRRRTYAVPPEWIDAGVKRYGFHGASHRYIATRTAQLMPGVRRIVSCHLGGSSSLCAIRDGASVATSMGLSAQSGLPQGNRTGDLDVYALRLMMARTGRSFDELLGELSGRSGLAGLSGTAGDMRDVQQAAAAGSERARLALEVFVTAVRDYLGAYLVELGGADAIVFTGGIGEHNPNLRARICEGLEFAGIAVDAARNAAATGEARFDAPSSKTALWVMPTNEELIVATQAAEFLSSRTSSKESAGKRS